MKKAIGFLLAVTLMVSLLVPAGTAEKRTYYLGQEIVFGHYEQDNNLNNGSEPIEWMIISADREAGTLLLVSKYILDCKDYHTKPTDGTEWGDCYIHNWLNSMFYETAFSQEEQSVIVPTYVSNSLDNVFMLDAEQIVNLLPTQICEATFYAQKHGVFVWGKTGGSSWWARRDYTTDRSDFVAADGSGIYTNGNVVNIGDNGVRPAISLSMDYLTEGFPGLQLRIGKPCTVDGFGIVTAAVFGSADRIGVYEQGKTGTAEEDFTACYDSGANARYMILKVDIENNTDQEMDYLQVPDVLIERGDGYRYRGWSGQYNYANGCSSVTFVNEADAGKQNENCVIDPADHFVIQPGETGHFCFVCTVPEELYRMNTILNMKIRIGEKKFTFRIQ